MDIFLKVFLLEMMTLEKPIAILNEIKKFQSCNDKIIHITIADEKRYAIANALILNK